MKINPTSAQGISAVRQRTDPILQITKRQSAESTSAAPRPGIDPAMLRSLAPSAMPEILAAAGGSATGTGPDELTVEGLMASWGKNDAQYDFDGNGTVDMNDLLELLSRQDAARTPPGTDREVIPGAELTTDGTVGAPAPIDVGGAPTIEGIIDSWGSPDGSQDLNRNGTVDFGDLLTLLNQAGDGAVPAPEGAPPTPQGTPTLEGIMAAWGQADAVNDLDGNGVVDMNDLMTFLNQQQSHDAGATGISPGENDSGSAVALGSENPALGAPAPQPQPLTVEGLMAQWGKQDSVYDLDGNGVVDMQDLLRLLEQQGHTRQRPEGKPADLRHIGDTLVQRLRDSGFENTPPTNLHDLVSGLNLSSEMEKRLLAGLAQKYPAGLGISLRG